MRKLTAQLVLSACITNSTEKTGHNKPNTTAPNMAMHNKTPHVLGGATLHNLFILLTLHRMDWPYVPKLLALLFWSVLLAPMYLLEWLLFAIIPNIRIHPEPIFIIGHWRSGTTYMHYLLAKDKQFGYCSNADAFAPGSILIGRSLIRKIISLRLPKKRPMDDVMLHVDSPQEDEFPMMLLTPYSCYHSFVFPNIHFKRIIDYVTLADPRIAVRWTTDYYKYLSKLSFRYSGKRLLLKNPVNTARIKNLINIFPNAKFIYLYRDAEQVKQSTFRMFTSMMDVYTLQRFDPEEYRLRIHTLHRTIIKEYETQRLLIDPANLIEIRYDDLVAEPIWTAKRIYDAFKIKGFEASRLDFEDFIASQTNYKPHSYSNN